MRWAVCLIVLPLLVGFVLHLPAAGQDQDHFTAAADAYRRGDYSAASRYYQQAVTNGDISGSVFYNLGNTYLQLGELGPALLAYRRAALFIPRDAELQDQMTTVRDLRQDRLSAAPNGLLGLISLTSRFLTTTELILGVFALWNVWFLMVTAHIVLLRWRHVTRIGLAAIGVLLLTGFCLLGGQLALDHLYPEAVVVSPQVQVTSGPGADYLPLFTLHAAAELRVQDHRNGWLRFQLPDGRQGWIPQGSVGYVDPVIDTSGDEVD